MLAACDRSQGNTDSHAILELYDTTSASDPGKVQCMFALPSRLNGRSSVEVYSGDSYHYNPSTFYTRPEERILTIFVEETSEPYQYQYPNHITFTVVFVNTLLRLSESRRFIAWEEWKQSVGGGSSGLITDRSGSTRRTLVRMAFEYLSVFPTMLYQGNPSPLQPL